MATITEKSRSKEIIDRMQAMIDGASSVPLAPGKISVYKDQMQELLNELAGQVERELITYHETNDKRGKIISEAKKEAEQIIYEAEHTASRMRVNKSTTGVAPLNYDTLNEEELHSLGNANEIYAASLIYTDEMLTEVNQMISDAYTNIRGDYEIILQVLEEKMNTINSNKQELMTSLQEMDTAERSQQMLEIGQLLSNELYQSRMKAKMDSDDYEDGSRQLSLEIAELQEEKARQAELEAQRAAEALEQMRAERDALKQTVDKMKNEGMSITVRDVKSYGQQADTTNSASVEAAATTQTPAEEEEYEIVYVTEDELEEGEEYEVEYVDEEEYEAYVNNLNKGEATASTATAASEAQAETTLKEVEEELDTEIPLIVNMKKTQPVAKVSDKQLKKIVKPRPAKVNGGEGFISRAVTQKENEELNSTVAVEGAPKIVADTSAPSKKKTRRKGNKPTKNSAQSTANAADGNKDGYVQATMKFDENYEITEF